MPTVTVGIVGYIQQQPLLTCQSTTHYQKMSLTDLSMILCVCIVSEQVKEMIWSFTERCHFQEVIFKTSPVRLHTQSPREASKELQVI